MKDPDSFRDWLVEKLELSKRAAGLRVSTCRTVEKYEGDLDYQFDRYGLSSLLRRLAYSRQDEARNRPPRHKIPIDGNIYSRTATLRNAVSLYREFRESRDSGSLGSDRERRFEIIPDDKLANWRKRLMKLLLAWEEKSRPPKGLDVAARIKHLEMKGIISEATGKSFQEVFEQCDVGKHERKRLRDEDIFILKTRWVILRVGAHGGGIHCLCDAP